MEVQRQTGRADRQVPFRLLTHPRYFGYGFNPISLYYCYERGRRGAWTAVVGEVTNTPWSERHALRAAHDRQPRHSERSGPIPLRQSPCTSHPSCRWTWTIAGV